MSDQPSSYIFIIFRGENGAIYFIEHYVMSLLKIQRYWCLPLSPKQCLPLLPRQWCFLVSGALTVECSAWSSQGTSAWLLFVRRILEAGFRITWFGGLVILLSSLQKAFLQDHLKGLSDHLT